MIVFNSLILCIYSFFFQRMAIVIHYDQKKGTKIFPCDAPNCYWLLTLPLKSCTNIFNTFFNFLLKYISRTSSYFGKYWRPRQIWSHFGLFVEFLPQNFPSRVSKQLGTFRFNYSRCRFPTSLLNFSCNKIWF